MQNCCHSRRLLVCRVTPFGNSVIRLTMWWLPRLLTNGHFRHDAKNTKLKGKRRQSQSHNGMRSTMASKVDQASQLDLHASGLLQKAPASYLNAARSGNNSVLALLSNALSLASAASSSSQTNNPIALRASSPPASLISCTPGRPMW